MWGNVSPYGQEECQKSAVTGSFRAQHSPRRSEGSFPAFGPVSGDSYARGFEARGQDSLGALGILGFLPVVSGDA